MTDIKPNARALMDEVKREHPTVSDYTLAVFAAQRAIEQHEAFKQEVSDAVEAYLKSSDECLLARWDGFDRFIIPKPKPDPLTQLVNELDWWEYTDKIRAALEARGLEIREKGK